MRCAKWMAALAAGVVFAALSPPTSADSVSFSVVSGVFGNNSSTATYSNSPTTVTLTFTAHSGAIDLSPMVDGQTKPVADFGTFAVSANNASNTITIDDTFTLTLDVTAPGLGSGSTTGTVDGTIRKNQSTDNLVISINSFSIPGVLALPRLAFDFTDITALSAKSPYDSATLAGQATYHTDNGVGAVVPVPLAAVSGVGLLGSMGLLRLRRRAA